jgi:hypothetical protein
MSSAKKYTLAALVLILMVGVLLLVLPYEPKNPSCGRAKDFVRYKSHLYQLHELLAKLHRSAGIKGFIVRMGDERDLVNLDKEGPISLDKAVAQRLATHKEELLKIKDIVTKNGIGYVSIEAGNSMWVTMSGGGVLGVDYGYVWVEGQSVPADAKVKYCAIPGETKWFAFSR